MWTYIKRGFGYGLGGSIGWNLGNLIWRWVSRAVGLIALAVGATWGLPMLGDSVGTYNDLQQKYAQQGRHHQQQGAGHAREH